MKIAIASESGSGMDSRVFGHFGSAPYFTIVDSETECVDVRDNRHEEHVHGNCKPASELGTIGVNAVACGGMGFRAISRFNEMGIKVYCVTDARNVRDVVQLWKDGKLSEMKSENACQGHDHHEITA